MRSWWVRIGAYLRQFRATNAQARGAREAARDQAAADELERASDPAFRRWPM
jgi:hypothetical protein